MTIRDAFNYIADTDPPRPSDSTTANRVSAMSPDSLKKRRLAGVFLFGWIFFNYPIFSLFNLPTIWKGIPLLYGYVFSLWALIILAIVLIRLQVRDDEKLYEEGYYSRDLE